MTFTKITRYLKAIKHRSKLFEKLCEWLIIFQEDLKGL